MKQTISLHGKRLQVELSDAAVQAAGNLEQPLVAELHLIFSCLVVKRVWFKPQAEAALEPVRVAQRLGVVFRVVRYSKSCRIAHIDSGEELPTDFPLVADKGHYVPDWLRIDITDGKWAGTFGYDRYLQEV